MTEPELIAVFAPLIESILSQNGVDINVVQLHQPTNQPLTVAGDSVFFSFLMDDNHGTQQRDMTYDNAAEVFQKGYKQQMVSLVQISVLYPQIAGAPRKYNPKDICGLIAQNLSRLQVIKELRKHNIGMMRITRIRSNFFENDKREFENMPSFDIYFTHVDTVTETVEQVKDLDGGIWRV